MGRSGYVQQCHFFFFFRRESTPKISDTGKSSWVNLHQQSLVKTRTTNHDVRFSWSESVAASRRAVAQPAAGGCWLLGTASARQGLQAFFHVQSWQDHLHREVMSPRRASSSGLSFRMRSNFSSALVTQNAWFKANDG